MKRKRVVSVSESGFTLIEAIFSIFILTAVVSLLPLMYLSLSSVERSLSLEEDFEWNLFLIQFRDELHSADSWRVGSNERVFLTKNRLQIKYERYGKDIRRQVNDTGHEIVLQNVQRLAFHEEGPMLVMNVEFLSGSSEQARFALPEKEEGEAH